MRTFRCKGVSFRWSYRHFFLVLLGIVFCGIVFVFTLGTGEYRLTPGEVIHVLLGQGSAAARLVVIELRLSRALLGLCVGAMLGLSGALVQSTTRNGLASPDLLGVTAGASTGAVSMIILGSGTGVTTGGLASVVLGFRTSFAALCGGILAAIIVGAILKLISGGKLQIVLIGVGVSAFFSGVTSWLLTSADIDDAERANAWLSGSLNGRGDVEMTVAGIVLGILAISLVPMSTKLSALHLSTELAHTLGHRVPLISSIFLVQAVVLASVSVAVAGPIGFVALVAPHIAQKTAHTSRPSLAISAIVGAVVLSASDLVARLLFAPFILPTGAVTAVIGAPFLIWLLLRDKKNSIS